MFEDVNLKKGREGEIKVINFLRSRGIEVKDYTDYSLHQHKQAKGYDIEVMNYETGEWDRVDIKTNSKEGYIYLEVKQANNLLGWFWTSSADSIYHYDLEENRLYTYYLKKMKNFVHRNDLNPRHGKYKDLIGLKVEDISFIKEIK